MRNNARSAESLACISSVAFAALPIHPLLGIATHCLPGIARSTAQLAFWCLDLDHAAAGLLAPSRGQSLHLPHWGVVLIQQQANLLLLAVGARQMAAGSLATPLQRCFQQILPPHDCWSCSLKSSGASSLFSSPATHCHSSCPKLHLSLFCFANVDESGSQMDRQFWQMVLPSTCLHHFSATWSASNASPMIPELLVCSPG